MKKISIIKKILLVSAATIAMISCSKEKDDIVIVCTGDIHGYIANESSDPETKVLRMSNISAYVKDLKKEGKEVLLVDAGDHSQGSIYTSYDQGASIINLMNKCGYDLSTIGNHDFDYGVDQLKENIKNADFDYICCNFKHNGERVFNDSKIVEIGNLKIGFVGITTPTTISTANPTFFKDENDNFVYSFDGDKNCLDFYNSFQNSVDAIKNKVDYVVGLTHVGETLSEKSGNVNAFKLIENTNGVDAFIGAHAHLKIESERIKNKDGKEILFIEPGFYNSCFGVIEIKKDGTITSKIESSYDNFDEEVKLLEDNIINGQIMSLGSKLATTENHFYTQNSEDSSQRVIRSQETNLGGLITDSYYWYFNEYMNLNCDVSIANGGGLRSEILPGDINYLTLRNVLPFYNVICLIKATGQELKDALEMGVGGIGFWDEEWNAPVEEGGFLHVAGMKYTIDCSIDYSIVKTTGGNFISSPEGEYKVKDIEIFNRNTNQYEPIILDKEYTIGGINYLLLNGGNGLTMFLDNETVVDYMGEEYMLAAEYIKSFSPINDIANVSSSNSPLKIYSNYLLDYENPNGSGRISIINKRY